MSIAPELGTRPRPDTTGQAEYSNAPVMLGINPQAPDPANNFWTPYGALEIHFDFPEDKYPPVEYQVELSLMEDFEAGYRRAGVDFNDPAAVEIPDLEQVPLAERKFTGISNTNSPGDFRAVAIAINPYSGDPSMPVQPDTQYYARVRAKLGEAPDVWSEWSEPLGCATEPLPDPNGMTAVPSIPLGQQYTPVRDLAPVAKFSYTVTGLDITVTDESVVNPITSEALHNTRYQVPGNIGLSATVVPGGPAVITAPAPGTYPLKQWVMDVTGKVGVFQMDVVVPAP